MRDQMRDKLNTEITRKQFLQYLAAAMLTLFGFHNLLSLLAGHGHEVRQVLVPGAPTGVQPDGFGTRKFGV